MDDRSTGPAKAVISKRQTRESPKSIENYVAGANASSQYPQKLKNDEHKLYQPYLHANSHWLLDDREKIL